MYSRFLVTQIIVVFVGLIWSSNAAMAQDTEVSLTTEQIELYNKAVKALNKNKSPDVAIDYMRAALREKGQHGNVLYMTLGRAYQVSGKCRLAKDNFKLAETKPSVKGVPADFVSKKLLQYRSEMGAKCPGRLTIVCKDPRVKITVNDKPQRCNATSEYAAGTYNVVATGAKKEQQTLSVIVQGDQDSKANITLELPKQKVIIREDTIPTTAIVSGVTTLVLSSGFWGYHFYAKGKGVSEETNYETSTSEAEAKINLEQVQSWAKRARYANRIGWGLAIAGTATTLAIIFWPEGESDATNNASSKAVTTWSPIVSPGPDGLFLGGQMRW